MWSIIGFILYNSHACWFILTSDILLSEAFTSKDKKNVLSDALAREALRLLGANIRFVETLLDIFVYCIGIPYPKPGRAENTE